ncbi:PROTEIN INVOLVED IN STARCH INITIATION [Hibiscus trionum]|uniref:PROTEIN INVOLVED IN STARCH INITIATION n=1 Tax=Hibiscus trionum TaxID=183268 RepID=A0A9W7M604_HIBTR|nr:PROTEIN INVOLVED IN STARCH INITIATION [Hibiscus trionum]
MGFASASCKHEKLEEQANLAFASQASQIEDLKLRLEERDQEVAAAQSSLSAKEDGIDKMRYESVKKSEEAEKICFELASKSWLLNEANEVIKKQQNELRELREAIQEKEEQLETSMSLRKLEEEKLKTAEAKLQQQTMEWLLAQEELKKLAEHASKHMEDANETCKDFTRVKQLLSDVRSELVSSQKSLASSRQQMEQQEQLLNQEIAELKMLMSSKENQLIQASALLKEKDEYVLKVQDELNDTKMKFSEAETVIERIAELTSRLVTAVKDEDTIVLRPVDDVGREFMHQLVDRPSNDFRLQKKQLETELKSTKESLKDKEMEVLAAQRALTTKDEDLKTVLGRLEAREKDLKRLKKEMIEGASDMNRTGEKKLQLEEVEAATSALQKLAEMSHVLLIKASTSVGADSDTSIFLQNGSDSMISMIKNDKSFDKVKTGVARLSALTEQLVKDSGIVGANRRS